MFLRKKKKQSSKLVQHKPREQFQYNNCTHTQITNKETTAKAMQWLPKLIRHTKI
jgi:hypothetical protein